MGHRCYMSRCFWLWKGLLSTRHSVYPWFCPDLVDMITTGWLCNDDVLVDILIPTCEYTWPISYMGAVTRNCIHWRFRKSFRIRREFSNRFKQPSIVRHCLHNTNYSSICHVYCSYQLRVFYRVQWSRSIFRVSHMHTYEYVLCSSTSHDNHVHVVGLVNHAYQPAFCAGERQLPPDQPETPQPDLNFSFSRGSVYVHIIIQHPGIGIHPTRSTWSTCAWILAAL